MKPSVFRGLWLVLGLVLLFRSTESRAECLPAQRAALIRSTQFGELMRLRAAVERANCPGIAAYLGTLANVSPAFSRFASTLPGPNAQPLCMLSAVTAADVPVIERQVETALAECAQLQAFRRETCDLLVPYDAHTASLRTARAGAVPRAGGGVADALDARVAPVRPFCAAPSMQTFNAPTLTLLEREQAKGAVVAFAALTNSARAALTAAQVNAFPSAQLTGGGDAPNVAGLIAGAVSGSSADATSLVSLLVQGVAQFVATRARAEFNLYVINRLRQTICAADTVPAQLMEHTCTFLSTGTDVLSPSFGATFVAAIADDASRLPQSLGVVIDRAVGLDREITLEGQRFSIVEAQRGTALLLARASLALVSSLGSSTDVRSIARAVDTIALRSTNNVSPYCGQSASCDAARQGLRLVAQLTIAIENQRLRPEESLSTEAADAIVDSIQAIVPSAALLTSEMVIEGARDVQDIVTAARQLRAASTSDARVAAIEPLMGAWVALINLSLRAALQNPPQLPEGLPAFVVALASGSMPRVVSRAIALVPAVLRAAGQSSVIAQVLPPVVIRALQFGADLSAATSADQVSAVIESVAMPVGGWLYKGRSRFSITLGSFVGVAGGNEYALGTTLLTPRQGFRGQLFAPVGFDFASGLGHGWTIGAMLSVINVGSLVALTPTPSSPTALGAANASSTEATRQMSPLSFIEPGVFLRLGIANSPVVVGGGASYLPYAHRVERTINGASALQDEAAVSVFGFLSIDVSIWQLFQSPRVVGATENQ